MNEISNKRGEAINNKARLGAKIVELKERIKRNSSVKLLEELAYAEIDYSLTAGILSLFPNPKLNLPPIVHKKEEPPFWTVQLYDDFGLFITSIFGNTINELRSNVSKAQHSSIAGCSLPSPGQWKDIGYCKIQDIRGADKLNITVPEWKRKNMSR